MKTLFIILILTLTMHKSSETFTDQVTEIVIYKVNKAHKDGLKGAIDQARSAVYDMPGFVSYRTYRSIDKDLLYMDFVVWESIEEAKAAAAKVTQLKEFADFGAAIEDIVIMDHLEFYH